MADKDDKVFDEVDAEMPRNENLTGAKSTQAPPEEAKQEQKMVQSHPGLHSDKEPEEVKASADVLPEDAELKSKLSQEEAH